MATAYSDYVTEWHGGRTRAYVKGYIESEANKTATIYVWGCAEGNNLTQYGVRTTVYINGKQVATATGNIFSPSGTSQVASCSGRLTIDKGSSSRSVSISAKISGETVDDYGPIAGSATATASVPVAAIVLMPPSPPTDLTATRDASANILLAWKNNASNATTTFVERCMKGGSWEQLSIEGAVSTYTDSPGNGYFKYRVRYGNKDGYSAYSNETDYVPVLSAPAAPTLVSPASGATVDANTGAAKLIWQHNANDTSPQTAAKLMWSEDNDSFETVELGAQSSHSLSIKQNQTIYWKVATKGAHEDYGPESGVSHFLVRTAPVAVLSVPAVLYSLPIPVSWEYEDAVGRQVSAKIEILDFNGTVLFAKTLAEERECHITAQEFPAERNVAYTVRLTVVSSTSLSYATQASTTLEYEPPARPAIAVAVDERRAESVVSVFAADEGLETPPTMSLTLLRDGEIIAEGLRSGERYLDRTPPLDRQVVYTAIAHAESGAIAKKDETVVVRSGGFAFFNFDTDKVAKVGMNISIKDQTQVEKESYTVASSKYPKVFYGTHFERSGTITADVFWAHDVLGYGEEAMLSSIEALKEHAGIVRLRLPYADSFNADVDISTDRSTGTYNIASVSIEWRRTG